MPVSEEFLCIQDEQLQAQLAEKGVVEIVEKADKEKIEWQGDITRLKVDAIVTTARPLRQQEVQLASCYSSCLDLANEKGLESIAFCCISTGEFRFPNDRACIIAASTVRLWMKRHPDSSIKTVIFNTFKDIDHELYKNALAKG